MVVWRVVAGSEASKRPRVFDLFFGAECKSEVTFI
jgi:hypothetical protein